MWKTESRALQCLQGVINTEHSGSNKQGRTEENSRKVRTVGIGRSQAPPRPGKWPWQVRRAASASSPAGKQNTPLPTRPLKDRLLPRDKSPADL